MPKNRDNEINFEKERRRRERALPIAGRIRRRWGHIRIRHGNRRSKRIVEVRQFSTHHPTLRPAS